MERQHVTSTTSMKQSMLLPFCSKRRNEEIAPVRSAHLWRNAQHAHLQRTLSQPALQLLRSTRWPGLRILLLSIQLGRPCFARQFSRRCQPRRNIRITRRWYRSEPRFFAGSLLLRNSPPAMPDNALPPRNYLHFGTRA